MSDSIYGNLYRVGPPCLSNSALIVGPPCLSNSAVIVGPPCLSNSALIVGPPCLSNAAVTVGPHCFSNFQTSKRDVEPKKCSSKEVATHNTAIILPNSMETFIDK
jgi:hypothetical protein